MALVAGLIRASVLLNPFSDLHTHVGAPTQRELLASTAPGPAPGRPWPAMVVAAALAGLVSDLSRLGLSAATADALALHAQQGGMPLDGARARASQALNDNPYPYPQP